MEQTIYKILPRTLWVEAKAAGRLDGAPVDLSDGFIHFSTSTQVRETAVRHFAGIDDLVLLAVDPTVLGDGLKYEKSRGGALFPHLYGSLPVDAILWVEDLPIGPAGHHLFPRTMP